MTRKLPARLSIAVVAISLTALMAAPAAMAGMSAKAPTVKVMTRNIYLGGNIFLPVGAQNRDEFEQKTQELWDQVRFTNFPARAKLIAREIKQQSPDLIGLQEVALWRRSPTGVKDGFGTPSTTVVYDFLKTLQRELKARGLRYRVAVVQKEADIEAPTRDYDVRLTMRDAILVKRKNNGVKVLRKRSKQFKADVAVPTQGGTFTSDRGWTYVDASLAGRKFRFLNTHLEAFLEDPRVKQAKELVASGGPARSKNPVIIVGDLNSDAEEPHRRQPGGLPDADQGRLQGQLDPGQGQGPRLLLLPEHAHRQRRPAIPRRPPHRPHAGQVADQRAAGEGGGHRPGQPHEQRPVAVRPRRSGHHAAARQ